MSGITLESAQAILDALIQAQIDDPVGALGSVSIGGHTVSYKSADDLIKSINFWQRTVNQLRRSAAGQPKHSYFLPNFRGCR